LALHRAGHRHAGGVALGLLGVVHRLGHDLHRVERGQAASAAFAPATTGAAGARKHPASTDREDGARADEHGGELLLHRWSTPHGHGGCGAPLLRSGPSDAVPAAPVPAVSGRRRRSKERAPRPFSRHLRCGRGSGRLDEAGAVAGTGSARSRHAPREGRPGGNRVAATPPSPAPRHPAVRRARPAPADAGHRPGRRPPIPPPARPGPPARAVGPGTPRPPREGGGAPAAAWPVPSDRTRPADRAGRPAPMGVTTMEPLLPPRPRPGPSLLLLCLFLLWSLVARL